MEPIAEVGTHILHAGLLRDMFPGWDKASSSPSLAQDSAVRARGEQWEGGGSAGGQCAARGGLKRAAARNTRNPCIIEPSQLATGDRTLPDRVVGVRRRALEQRERDEREHGRRATVPSGENLVPEYARNNKKARHTPL